MTVSLQTLLDRSNKNMDKGTHPVVRDKALEMVKKAYKEGIYVQISEGYRSRARQQQLYNQGRTTPGKVVTNAKPGQSIHNYGKAVDFFLVSDDGSKALWNVNRKWRRAAEIGKSLGFEWGGDWTSFKDYPHLQMKDVSGGGSQSNSKWTKVTGNWTGQTLKRGQYGEPVKQLQKKLGVKVDGYFGEDTEKAVKNVQRGASIAVDGLAGKNTYKALTGANLKVDGYLGKNTIKALQRYFKTPVDGIISKPSVVIKSLQKLLRVKADGYLGPVTIRAMQKRFGTPQDGIISKPSVVIKELQRRLNKGRL